ncbi:MAG: hypothetical protein FNT29_08145 [Halothiobacillaceae bacterium]|nr:MAG: hypothetical protein FNT29_08145 [Halothiobacillaceae bacterium]
MFDIDLFYLLGAVLAGIFSFGLMCALIRSAELTWLLSIAAAMAAVYVLSPQPLPADSLFHIERDAALLAKNILYFIGWMGGSFLGGLGCRRLGAR